MICLLYTSLEKATEDAIKTFGDENSVNIILENSFEDYMNGFKDKESGKIIKGYIEISKELVQKFQMCIRDS